MLRCGRLICKCQFELSLPVFLKFADSATSHFKCYTEQFNSYNVVIVLKRIRNVSFNIVETFVSIPLTEASIRRIYQFELRLIFPILRIPQNHVSSAVLDSSTQIRPLLCSNESGMFRLTSLKLSFQYLGLTLR